MTTTHLGSLTYWVEVNASAPVDNYLVDAALTDFLEIWPDLLDIHPDALAGALIDKMAATLEDGTPFDGRRKLLGVLACWYYAPRFRPGGWSPARDAAGSVPCSIGTGEAFYRV